MLLRRVRPILLLAFSAGMLVADEPAVTEPAVTEPAVTASTPTEPLWEIRFTPSSADEGKSNAPHAESEATVLGRVLIEAVDGGILVEDRAGRLWNITPAQLISRNQTGQPFEPFNHQQLEDALKGELGDQFQIVHTAHYVIATSGSRIYAEWCGAIFERLLEAFVRYWQAAGLEIVPPEAPLPVIVHGSRTAYAAAARRDGGAALMHTHGYYSMQTNRIALVDVPADGGIVLRSRAQLVRFIAAQPAPISTIVHEATHQIAFNCGMHTRFADNPVWLTEGMAMLFEVPDLSSHNGWKTIGRINRPRLNRFRESLQSANPPSLISLVADDERFRNPHPDDDPHAETAYAQAWALSYFLIKTRRPQYVAFVKQCSENTQLVWKTRNQRLADFKHAFDLSPEELEEQFLQYVRRIR